MHIILNSYGAALQRDHGNFLIKTAQAEQRLNPGQVRSISVGKGAKMTSDAVLLAIEHQIDVVFVDHSGMPQGRVWSVRFGSVSDIRRQQLDFFYGTEALDWVKALVSEKIDNQLALLLTLQIDSEDPLRRRINRGIRAMEDYRNKVKALDETRLEDAAPTLRGWEGAASRKYFQLISAYLPEAYRFERRSQHPAADDFNALLNYGYGMLYGKIEGALIRAGVDPYLGIFHRDGYNRPALVYDVIERYRIWVDYVVLQLCRQEAMTEECFRWDGKARMLDGLGKRILIQSVNDYLAEIIQRNGLRRSRREHLQLEAHALARFFLEYSPVKLPSEQ
ncbi:CRISPR-associated endonuclease Cas1 [Neolewinella agarilytica]|uniref:CRISPR-associated endonuclease Cas1 n=1 Tax=Neolewinella agarilytica TaxID=478744 RepID=A0A1H8Z8S7_9BACT|nr:CRISPR-associated endonuclease Cas1 [Neolewinella agarilytica]SEP60835.1 CRISP-associated protein Cas1 [Neolewinella agarilytica]